MLLVGTDRELFDLDRSLSLAEDVSMTDIATSGSDVFAVLDRSRIVRVDRYGCSPVCSLDGVRALAVAAAGNAYLSASLASDLGEDSLAESGDVSLVVALDGGSLATVSVADGDSDVRPVERPAFPGEVSAISVAGTRWIVALEQGGLVTSDDSGSTWQRAGDPSVPVAQVVLGPAGWPVAATPAGLAWSKDGGSTWEAAAEGLHSPSVRAVASDDESVYLAAGARPAQPVALYRGTLGRPFEKCTGGLAEWLFSEVAPGCLHAAGGRVAFATADGRVFQSADYGASFDESAERLGGVRCLRILASEPRSEEPGTAPLTRRQRLSKRGDRLLEEAVAELERYDRRGPGGF